MRPRPSKTTLTAALVAAGIILSAGQAAAQSCGDLWYERNSIYAAAGHCFATARGIAAFGKGCFPPHGRLNATQQARVNAIQAQERRRGC